MRARPWLVRTIAALLLAPLLTAAAPSNPPPEGDQSSHGAVLCAWMIEISLKIVGDRCFPEPDKEVQAALNESIDRINQFIVVNAPSTPDDVRRSQETFEQQAPPDICSKGDGVAMYNQFRKGGAAGIRKWTDDLLSVPRKPLMNPCL